jgi:hypothetical protein
MGQTDRDLVVENLPDGGLLVMEPDGGRSHTLNASAAAVWQAWREGEHDVTVLAERVAASTELPADEGIIHSALARLKDARLVTEEIPQPSLESVSRRRLLRLAAGAAFALPFVETIVTPSPGAAQSLPAPPPAAPPTTPPPVPARFRRPVG